MEFVKTYHEVLSITRENNQYNKYLKWKLVTKLKGINPAEDNKLIPYEERQEIIDWFRTLKEAGEKKRFYETYYQSDWSSGSWKKREQK